MIPEIYCTIFSHVFILDCVGAIWEKMSRGGGEGGWDKDTKRGRVEGIGHNMCGSCLWNGTGGLKLSAHLCT